MPGQSRKYETERANPAVTPLLDARLQVNHLHPRKIANASTHIKAHAGRKWRLAKAMSGMTTSGRQSRRQEFPNCKVLTFAASVISVFTELLWQIKTLFILPLPSAVSGSCPLTARTSAAPPSARTGFAH